MYKRILVPLDGSQLAECSLNHVKNLAKDGSIGEVILLHAVTIELPLQEINLDDTSFAKTFDFIAFRNERLEQSKKYLETAQLQLIPAGIAVTLESIVSGRPAHTIIDYAQQKGMDLIVLTTHGRTGLKKMLLGSVAFKILHESSVPVLLIRPESCLA
jgi:nucleotide-binding universal stress UspA family protein